MIEYLHPTGLHLHIHRDVIAALGGVTEPLDVLAMARIVDGHGRLTTRLKQLTCSHSSQRSFAAKYLHVHRPCAHLRRALGLSD